eukprot:1162023-Pelagomonas_calceolata.AAC.3
MPLFLVGPIQISSLKLQIGSPGLTWTAAARFRTASQTTPSYLFPRSLSMRARSASSRPDAISITPYNAKHNLNNVSPSCSHHASRNRHSTTQRTSTTSRVRKPHQLNACQRHVHLIEIKYCKDTRSQHQLETALQQHADLCKHIS